MCFWLVALRKESVDRNKVLIAARRSSSRSLSARRAWIEISIIRTESGGILVALRKESVDRNKHKSPTRRGQSVALRKESVDRNFISFTACWSRIKVALRKESVDRN